MSQTINIPQEIEKIFDKCGSKWSDAEIVLATEYIFAYKPKQELKRREKNRWDTGNKQLKELLVTAAWHLGDYATDADAEDVVQFFYLKRFERIIKRYDPQAAPFWQFLKFCFIRFCHAYGRKLRKLHKPETSLTQEVVTKAGDTIELEMEDTSPDNDHLRKFQYKQQRENVIDLIKTMPRLTQKYREIFVLCDIEECEYEELTERLGKSVGTLKTRLCRARIKIKEYLVKSGVEL